MRDKSWLGWAGADRGTAATLQQRPSQTFPGPLNLLISCKSQWLSVYFGWNSHHTAMATIHPAIASTA